MADILSCTAKEWFVHARDVLRIAPHQALNTWVSERSPRLPDVRPPVPHFRKKCLLEPGGAVVNPEMRARTFARNACLSVVRRCLDGEDVSDEAFATAPVNVVAHDIPGDKEGGVKFYACMPCALVAESAFADPAERLKRSVKNIFEVVPAGGRKFKEEWISAGQPVEAYPNVSWYVERTDGEFDDWGAKKTKYAKPYAFVLDVDGKHLVGDNRDLYADAKRRMEIEASPEEDGVGPCILKRLIDVLKEELELLIPGATVGALAFASGGEKPSYRVYVRFKVEDATGALVFADIGDARAFVVHTLIPSLEMHEWYRTGLVDGATYSKGWDRAVGMAKWSSDTTRMRFLNAVPLALSWDAALRDWERDKTKTLLSCLGLTYDATTTPLPKGLCMSDKLSNKNRKRSRDSLASAASAGERVVSEEGTDVIAELVHELVERHVRPYPRVFSSGVTSVEVDVNGTPRNVKVTCAANNAFCPFRDLDVDAQTGRFVPSTREAHAKMAEGKIALFISLTETFPCVRANCFSPKCRCTGRLFNLGALMPEQRMRLLRVLSDNM